jgi:hypothetical protein
MKTKKKYTKPQITRIRFDQESVVSLAACRKDIDGENGCWPAPLYRRGVGTPNRFNFDPS